MQRLGLVLATGLYGLAIGGLLSLAFAALRGRTAHRSERRLALGLAASLFVAVVAVPLLKYPANPPGVGDPETIGYRTELYLTIVAGSLAALLAAWRVARLVPAERRGWRNAAAAATFCALAAILALALPGVDEVRSAYPTGLLDDFRLASAALQLTLWSVLGVSFAILVGRRPRRPGSPVALPLIASSDRVGRQRHVDELDPERSQGIEHRVDEDRCRSHRPRLAGPLRAETVVRRRCHGPIRLQVGQLGGTRERVVEQTRGQRLAVGTELDPARATPDPSPGRSRRGPGPRRAAG